MNEKIYRVKMNHEGLPNFSTAMEIPAVNMPIKEKCCFCPHCSNCDVNDDLTIADRPQGKWERDGHHIRCNQCGVYFCTEDREGNAYPQDFCPLCGARMKGADDADTTDQEEVV